MSEVTIEVNNLTKYFGKFCAVDNINFEIKKGRVFGFLGANGAGKSTTIKMLCGILTPTSGSAKIGGFDLQTKTNKIKENIGYMSQKFSLYEDLTVEENLNFFGKIYGLSNSILIERKNWVKEISNLNGNENKIVKTLSVGWKQRLALGCAVIHKPKILFLDEPTSGVDPLMRRKFWELIYELSNDGTTILVTTHFLEEAEYCNDIILIDVGKIIARGTPKELKEKIIQYPILEIRCDSIVDAMNLIEDEKIVIESSIFGTKLHAVVEEEKNAIEKIQNCFSKNEIQIFQIEKITPSLEDVFIYLLDKNAK